MSPTGTPFERLSQLYGQKDESERAWWQKSGSMLETVMESAGYDHGQQEAYLKFFAEVMIPLLGPFPQKFNSSISRSGLPLEYSINYQQSGKPPVVRIGYEPVNALSGTDKDPFNKIPAFDLVSALSKLPIPTFDTELWDYAVKAHSVNDAEKASIDGQKLDGGYLRSQTAFGFDLVGGGKISIKGYTFPALKAKITGKSVATILAESVEELKPIIDCSPSFSMVQEYLSDDGFDSRSFFSWDFVKPADSRLKMYSCSSSVTSAKLEEVWTLGGRLKGETIAKGLQYLRQIFYMIQIDEGERTIEEDFDDREDTSKATPLVWNYEMRAGSSAPLTKIYFPIHGENDMKIISGVARFFRNIGMVELGNSYVDTVKSYFPKHDLSKTDRFTSWVSFAYTEKTGVYLSCYYHASTDNPWNAEEEQNGASA